jgi:hypothetical protein
LGEELCGECPISGDLIYNENIKRLGFFCGIDEIDKAKKNVPAILNFIKYKQSFIADTLDIDRVDERFLDYSRVISMAHVF